MDHTFPTDELTLAPGLAAIVARVSGFISAGGRAVVLLGPPGAGKSAVLGAILAALTGRQTRIANAGPYPLTMKRMLRQMGAAPHAMNSGHFFRSLAEQAYDDESAVVAVDDAHTLSPYALASLARIPGLGGPEMPGMILLLAGEVSLLSKLAAPGLELLRNSRRALVLTFPDTAAARYDAAPPARLMWTTLAPEAPPAAIPEPPRRPVAEPELLLISRTGPHPWQPALAGAVVLAAVIVVTLWPSRVGDQPHPARLPAIEATAAPAAALPAPPEPAPPGLSDSGPAAPTATAPTPVTPTAPAAEAPAPVEPDPPARPELTEQQLRREFDAFLDRAGRDTAKMTPAAREALFREYLAWRARANPSP